MRSFFRHFLRRRPSRRINEPAQKQTATQRTMSGGMTMAAAYALTLTSPTALGAVPEEAAEKAHHLNDGKGFTNPWESWREFNAPQMIRKMIWWAAAFPF
jgi:N-acyl-phosphatidylethanolamine-hydrolysing phospholipase D